MNYRHLYIIGLIILILSSCSKNTEDPVESNLKEKFWRVISKRINGQDTPIFERERSFYFKLLDKDENAFGHYYEYSKSFYWLDYQINEIDSIMSIQSYFYNPSFTSDSKFLNRILAEPISTWDIDHITDDEMLLSFIENDTTYSIYFLSDEITNLGWE